MRLLFTSVPGASHVLPVVPLAHAALAAGHDVLVVSSGSAVPTAAAAGLHTVDAGDGAAAPYLDMARRLTETDIAHTWSPEELTDWFASVFAEIGAITAGPLLEAARSWGADAVVYPPPHVVGLIAARALGVPAVLHGLGTRRPTFRPAVRHSAKLVEELGLDDVGEADVEIDLSPASLTTVHLDVPEESRARDTLAMRYAPYTGGGVLPDWLLRPRRRRRVAATLGSIPLLYGDGGLLQVVVDAAAALDVELVLTTNGAALPGLAGDLPGHVRPVDWISLRALLPTCEALIHHGGMGSMYAAFDAAVPQLALPAPGTDSTANASVPAVRGAGLRVDARDADTAAVTAALGRLLDEPAFGVAAAEVAAEIRAMPTPAAVLDRLTGLLEPS
ncbi:nucleotide disphospho-sugar-binding domain-containing protein [Pseudonocardia nematodicida]|uniref:Nucleotide disphospho-sugar-binding domain-containing protein n=1 Tax=Pseudonocardia nematodicida TaxID=1206997 RepID=A0ABV1KGS5_9PSEU